MGNPNTIDICGNCREPIIQWGNTGAWEHLGSANANQAQSRAYVTNAKTEGATICSNPKKQIEQNTVSGRTTVNYRTAKKG